MAADAASSPGNGERGLHAGDPIEQWLCEATPFHPHLVRAEVRVAAAFTPQARD